MKYKTTSKAHTKWHIFARGISDAFRLYPNKKETKNLETDFYNYIESHPLTVEEDLRKSFSDSGAFVWRSLAENVVRHLPKKDIDTNLGDIQVKLIKNHKNQVGGRVLTVKVHPSKLSKSGWSTAVVKSTDQNPWRLNTPSENTHVKR